jgi:hypothetical protein
VDDTIDFGLPVGLLCVVDVHASTAQIRQERFNRWKLDGLLVEVHWFFPLQTETQIPQQKSYTAVKQIVSSFFDPYLD